MLCSFANSFPNFVADFLDSGLRLRRRFREETVTDMMMGSLLSLGGGAVIVEFPNEPVTGADMQWDFVNRSTKSFFRILLQAKQLFGKGRFPARHCYRELLHKVGAAGNLQAQLLCDTARSTPGTYPLYAFYNAGRNCRLAHTHGLSNVEGVNLACGYFIENLVVGANTRMTRTKNKQLGTIYPSLFSLRNLFCPQDIRPLGPMNFALPAHTARFLVFGRSSIGVPLPPRPEDIRARLTAMSSVKAAVPMVSEIPLTVLRRIGRSSEGLEPDPHEKRSFWRVTFLSTDPEPDSSSG